MSLHRVWITALFCFACLALAVSPRPTLAATYTAGTANDLIASIANANINPDADTILLTADISLTTVADSNATYGDSGLPVITSNITIEGQGYEITRSVSAPSFRIVRVTDNGKLTVVNTVMSNGKGHSGGAIFNMFMGTLTVLNSTLSGNSAVSDNNLITYAGGGIYNRGILTITNSTLSDNSANIGGAIGNYSGGSMVITSSTFSGNNATVYGGAFVNWQGTISIANGTFSGNSIGITANSNGGAIYQFGGTVTITNSTFLGNSTGFIGGAIYLMGGALNITNTTIAGNFAADSNAGIAIENGEISVNYSTISGNYSPSGANGLFTFDLPQGIITTNSSIVANNLNGNCSTTVASSFSLADDASCSGFTNSPTINLAALADNGGSTQSMALNAGSSALDAGDSTTCPTTDQRGVARGIDTNGTPNDPATGDCDIGAFESGGIIRTLQFAATTSNVVWGTTPSIPVALSLDAPLPANYGAVTAYVWITGGSARAGVEYAPFGMQKVVFNPGDQTKTLNINLLNSALTSDRTIILSIATQNGPGFSGPAILGTKVTHTVIIHLEASPTNAAPNRNFFMIKQPTLTWNRVSQAVRYDVEIASNNVFSSATKYDAGNALTFTWPVPLPNGTYYWHTRACTAVSAASCGAWSMPDTFVVFAP